MRHLVLIAVLLFSSPITAIAKNKEPISSSAHSDALHLVMTTQSDALRRLDTDSALQETASRTWEVFRPASSGVLDMTHTFIVRFSIGGKVVASWAVNTAKASVDLQPAQASQP